MVRSLRRVALAMLAVFSIVGVAEAQRGVFPIQVVGLSPYKIAQRGLEDIWPDIKPTSGLPTVLKGDRVVLEAQAATLNTMAWEITQAPDGSALLNVSGTDTMFSFVPDEFGSYEISLELNGDGTVHTLWITAGDWVGRDATAADPTLPSCSPCHNAQLTGWKTTSHSVAQRNFGSAGCLDCHATGYDGEYWETVLGYTFPGRSATAYDSIKTNHPEQARLFNVQCEACHGPSHVHKDGGYFKDKNQTSVSYGADACLQCHDQVLTRRHDPIIAAWDVSAHANYSNITGSGTTHRSTCSGCHTAQGYVNQTVRGGTPTEYEYPHPITCAACHDPHHGDTPYNLRSASVGESCNSCHTLRVSGRGFHYSHQSSLLAGKDGAEFPGYYYPSSIHSEVTCAECHMAGVPSAVTALDLDAGDAARVVGGHTFKVVGEWDGQEILNDEGCISCHGQTSLTFVRMSQNTIKGLLDELQGLLPVYGDSPPAGFASGEPVWSGPELTAAEEGAAYNWYYVKKEGSYGVHNSRYAEALLRSSIAEVQKTSIAGEIVEIADVPNDQGKQVTVKWNAFPAEYSGTAKIKHYEVLRWDTHLSGGGDWVTVYPEKKPHDAMPEGAGVRRYAVTVPTLYDSTADDGIVWTKYKVLGVSDGMTFVSPVDSGYSVDNIEPNAPAMARYVQETGKLAWTPSTSDDVRYYAVYRAALSGTVVADGAPFAMLVDTAVTVDPGFQYGVVAVDFAGNVSDLSPTVLVDAIYIPERTALLGNAPNPFNATTEIRYELHEATHVKLVVYNVLGQPIRTLVSDDRAVGVHSVLWDGIDKTGQSAGSGTYLYVMTTETGFRDTGRMTLLR